MGDNENIGVTITGFFLQPYADTPECVLLTGVIHNRYTLFIYFAGFGLADIFLFAKKLQRVIFMFSNNKECTPVAMPQVKPSVQKLRSAIQASALSTVNNTDCNKERSCAWPSSQGNTSIGIRNMGS